MPAPSQWLGVQYLHGSLFKSMYSSQMIIYTVILPWVPSPTFRSRPLPSNNTNFTPLSSRDLRCIIRSIIIIIIIS
jgi:hypothetical protein